MGMSTYVFGFVSPEDETYKKHATVLMACVEAELEDLPRETAEYFGDDFPDEYLLEQKLQVNIPIHKYEGDMQSGYEIFVSEIPKGVHKIRFVNMW